MPTTGEGDGAASNGSSFTHAQWPAPQHGIQSLPPKEKQKARDAAANPGVYEQAMRPQEHSGPQGNNGKASKFMRLRTTAGADGSHAEQAVRGSAGASSAESDKNAVSACQRQLCRLVGNFLRNAPGPRPAHGALAALHPPPAPRLSAVVSMAVDDVPTVLVPGRVPLGQQQQRRVLGWACVGGRPTCVDGLLRQASDPLVLMSTLGGIDVQSGENEQQWRARTRALWLSRGATWPTQTRALSPLRTAHPWWPVLRSRRHSRRQPLPPARNFPGPRVCVLLPIPAGIAWAGA